MNLLFGNDQFYWFWHQIPNISRKMVTEKTYRRYIIIENRKSGMAPWNIFCGVMPFAVCYDAQSRIVLDDFPWFDKIFLCPTQTNGFQFTGLSGIHVKYITTVNRYSLDN
jgi:hypothetical protein